MDINSERRAGSPILGFLPWGLFAVCALLLIGLNTLHSIEIDHQRKNVVQVIHWLQRAQTDHASREEIRRFFVGGNRSEEADWFTYSPAVRYVGDQGGVWW